MNPITRQILSAFSISFLCCAGGVGMAYPGMAMAQWKPTGSGVYSTKDYRFYEGMFASISQLVCIPGSLIGGVLVEKFGPRKLSLVFLPLLGLSWIFITLAANVPSLLIFVRIVQSSIMSVIHVIGCMYPSEIAEVSRRGFLGAFVDAQFSLGFLLTYVLGSLVSWEYFGYIAIVLTIIPGFIGIWFSPESAIWLIRRGCIEEAKKELMKIRSSYCDVELEVNSEVERVKEDTKMSMQKRIALLVQFRYFMPVISVVILLVLKESSGQIAIVLYVVQIFRMSNTGLSSNLCSIIAGTTRLICNIISCFLLSKVSRKYLLVGSTFVGSLMMAILSVYFHFEGLNQTENMSWVPFFCVILFMMVYGIGMGPTSWLIGAEILPNAVRNIGSGICQAAFNVTQCAVIAYFSLAQTPDDFRLCFFLFAIGSGLLGFFVIITIPETKNKTINQIEDIYANKEKKLKIFLNFDSIEESFVSNESTIVNISLDSSPAVSESFDTNESETQKNQNKELIKHLI